MRTRPVTPLEVYLYEVPVETEVALFSVGEEEGFPELLHGVLLLFSGPDIDGATLLLRTDVGTDYGYLFGTREGAARLPEKPRPEDLDGWEEIEAL